MVFVGTMQFHVGQKFSCFEEIQEFLSEFEKQYSFNLIRGDSKMLESAQKMKPRRLEDANSRLKIYYLKLCCNFGGKAHKKRTNTDKQRRLTQ